MHICHSVEVITSFLDNMKSVPIRNGWLVTLNSPLSKAYGIIEVAANPSPGAGGIITAIPFTAVILSTGCISLLVPKGKTESTVQRCAYLLRLQLQLVSSIP